MLMSKADYIISQLPQDLWRQGLLASRVKVTGPPLTKSYDPLVTQSHEFTSQLKNKISPLPRGLQAPNLTSW